MWFDTVLTAHVGDWGRGQLMLLLASSSSWTTLSLIVLGMVFVTQQPQWECSTASDTACQGLLQQQQEGICQLDPEHYAWVKPHTSLVATFNLVCGDHWKVGLSNAIFFLGYWVGSSLFGWVADSYGRKKCLLLSNLASAVAAVLCGVSPSYWWYVLARTALGFCCSGLPIAAYVLATESVGPSYRGRAGTYNQVVYHVGEWILPLMAFWLQDWRLLYWAIAGWCIATAAAFMPFPESPRWLLLHGREQEARATLQWLASLNGRQLPDDVVLSAATAAGRISDEPEAAHSATSAAAADGASMSSSVDAVSADARAAAAKYLDASVGLDDATDCTALLVDQEDHSKAGSGTQDASKPTAAAGAPCNSSEGLSSVFRHPLLMRFFLVTMLLCLVMATAFYIANLATDSLTGSLYTNFLLTSVGELPAALVAAVAVDRVGRKMTIGSGLWATGVACGACSLLPSGWWTTALASVGKAACSGTWTIAYIYAAELFPTSIRSVALAGTNQASRLGGILAPVIIYISQQLHWSALPFALAGAVSILTGALLNKLPETNGLGQPETLADLQHMYGPTAPGLEEHSSTGWSSRWRSFMTLLKGANRAGGVERFDEGSHIDCGHGYCNQTVKSGHMLPRGASHSSSNSWYIRVDSVDSGTANGSRSSGNSFARHLQMSCREDVCHGVHQAGATEGEGLSCVSAISSNTIIS